MGKVMVFIAGVAAGAAASAIAGQHGAALGVSAQVVPTAAVSVSEGPDAPVLRIGAHRVILEGNGSAVATVEY